MVNEITIKSKIKPYIEEATIQMVIDILVVLIVSIVFTLVKMPSLVCIMIPLCYFAIALFFHYKIAIQSLIDKHKENYITEIISIKSIDEEFSFAGDRFGHSYIRHLYPKDMNVWKCKIKVVDKNGEQKKLRAVMSSKQSLNFMVLDTEKIEYIQITYLKRSKILLHVDLVEEPVQFTGKRKKVIEKAIHCINSLI
ncbi:MAG: hypothetical protein IJB72_02135 [Clostridia bacterium]|nr:hypothetical protein [Clostridia bacterium]